MQWAGRLPARASRQRIGFERRPGVEERGLADLGGDNLGRSMQDAAASRQAFASEDEGAIRLLRTSGSIAILFLIAYLICDLGGNLSSSSILAFYHWLSISMALLFF